MANGLRSRALIWLVAGLAVVFGGLQFLRPRLDNPPVTAEIQVPDDVKAILKNSCYNCHSNETKLAWFDLPVPIYWQVVRDVKGARSHLNFSEIGKLPLGAQRAALYEGLFQAEQGAMPLRAYTIARPESVLTPEKAAVLKKYLASVAQTGPASAEEIGAADAQYERWIQGGDAGGAVSAEPNGFEFLPDYKNWKTISNTDRFDNHTIRVVLGNDIAVKAVAENHINPWPEGAAFAKVAWLQEWDANGTVRPGAFFQVEFMLRDSKKYASTLGWGWGRWRGADLKPYGKDAEFAQECVGCHRPLASTNYVFTEPIARRQ